MTGRTPAGTIVRQFVLCWVLPLSLAACGPGVPDDPGTVEGEALETPYAETFSVVERNGYRIVDIEASVVTWAERRADRRNAPVSCWSRRAWSRRP